VQLKIKASSKRPFGCAQGDRIGLIPLRVTSAKKISRVIVQLRVILSEAEVSTTYAVQLKIKASSRRPFGCAQGDRIGLISLRMTGWGFFHS
jgi:hypothetical protein